MILKIIKKYLKSRILINFIKKPCSTKKINVINATFKLGMTPRDSQVELTMEFYLTSSTFEF